MIITAAKLFDRLTLSQIDLLAKFGYGWNTRGIAEYRAVSISSVKRQLHRLRKELAVMIDSPVKLEFKHLMSLGKLVAKYDNDFQASVEFYDRYGYPVGPNSTEIYDPNKETECTNR